MIESRSQKVWLRVVGVIADTVDDQDDYPDRVLVTGSCIIKPNVPRGYVESVIDSSDGQAELRVYGAVELEIIDGLISYAGKPFVWLVASEAWGWNISFNNIRVDGKSKQVTPFNFRVDPATPAQVANAKLSPSATNYYRGVSLADLLKTGALP